MATLVELRGLFADSDLRNRVTVATVIEANDMIAQSSVTAQERAFAQAVFSNPQSIGFRVLMSVLAANASASVAQIQGASDSAIQSNVANVFPQLVSAFAGE